MSFCKDFGKDKVIFCSKDDCEKPSKIVISDLDSDFEEHGLVGPNGELNWSCPCVGNMASGPCGFYFKEAFGCFHTSKAEPKGSDCVEKFVEMQQCFNKYPNLYDMNEDDEINNIEKNEEKNNLNKQNLEKSLQ